MSKFNAFSLPIDRINTHSQHELCGDSWWTQYAAPGQPKEPFYAEVHRRDAEVFSRQTKQIPVFNDVRFGGFKPQYQMAEWDPK